MNKAIISGLLAFFATTAIADDVVIGAGKKGRGYDKWANEIAQQMNMRGVNTTVSNFTGSDAITLGLCDGKISFAPAQQDAAFQRQLEGCILEELWTYPSEEYMILMVPKGSDIDELDDLTEGDTVLTDEAGSGSDFTLRQIRRIEQGEFGNKSAWSKMTVMNGSLKKALGLAAGGKIRAAFFVGNQGSDDVQFFIKNGWVPIEVYDKDLNDLMYGDKPLYDGGKVKVYGAYPVWTYRVKTMVYGNELPQAQYDVFESIMATR